MRFVVPFVMLLACTPLLAPAAFCPCDHHAEVNDHDDADHLPGCPDDGGVAQTLAAPTVAPLLIVALPAGLWETVVPPPERLTACDPVAPVWPADPPRYVSQCVLTI